MTEKEITICLHLLRERERALRLQITYKSKSTAKQDLIIVNRNKEELQDIRSIISKLKCKSKEERKRNEYKSSVTK